jgi:hypothetical protein
MAIVVPQPGQEISATNFGAPVANQLNLLSKAGRGLIQSVVINVDQSGISSSSVFLTSYDITWTTTETRSHRIEFIAQAQSPSATSWIFYLDVDGSVSIVNRYDGALAGQTYTAYGFFIGTYAAGTHRARMKASATPANGTIASAGANNGRFVVTDVGP